MESLPNSYSRYVTSFDNTQIAYSVIQPTTKPHRWLIFLHGLGGDLSSWDQERKIVSHAGYGTIAVDLRGHGLSDRPRNEGAYSMQNFAEDIIAVLKQEDIQKSVIIGHCFGAMVTFVLEAMYPTTAKALVVIDTSYKPPTFGRIAADHRIINTIVSFLRNHAPTIHEVGHVNTAKFLGTRDFSAKRILSDVLHTSLRSYLNVCDQITHFNATDLLKRIHVPTLVITGVNDLIFPPSVAEDLHHRIKNSHIDFIDNGNHMVIINNPKDVTKDIQKFLNTINY